MGRIRDGGVLLIDVRRGDGRPQPGKRWTIEGHVKLAVARGDSADAAARRVAGVEVELRHPPPFEGQRIDLMNEEPVADPPAFAGGIDLLPVVGQVAGAGCLQPFGAPDLVAVQIAGQDGMPGFGDHRADEGALPDAGDVVGRSMVGEPTSRPRLVAPTAGLPPGQIARTVHGRLIGQVQRPVCDRLHGIRAGRHRPSGIVAPIPALDDLAAQPVGLRHQVAHASALGAINGHRQFPVVRHHQWDDNRRWFRRHLRPRRHRGVGQVGKGHHPAQPHRAPVALRGVGDVLILVCQRVRNAHPQRPRGHRRGEGHEGIGVGRPPPDRPSQYPDLRPCRLRRRRRMPGLRRIQRLDLQDLREGVVETDA